MRLFDKYDIVVLGERDHNDTTQYDLIEEIISDPRFIEKVGNIMTEVGVSNMTGELNKLLNAKYKHNSIFDNELANMALYLDFSPV